MGRNLETATEIFGLKSEVKVWRKLAGNWDRRLMGNCSLSRSCSSMVRVDIYKEVLRFMTENECKEKVLPRLKNFLKECVLLNLRKITLVGRVLHSV